MDNACNYRYFIPRPNQEIFLPPEQKAPCLGNFEMKGRNVCGIILFILLLLVGFYLMKSCMQDKSAFEIPRGYGQSMKCSVTGGSRPDAQTEEHQDMSNIKEAGSRVELSNWDVNTQTSGNIPSSFVNMESTTGQSYDKQAFMPSETTQEFYNVFNPSKFTSLMPGSWRKEGEDTLCVASAGTNETISDKRFDEFGRYSVSPISAQNAESLRGTIRLSELSSTRNSRTLGSQSLLREAVSPVGPIPIGSKNYAWGDSSERLAMVAAATGNYPSEIGC